MITLKQIVRRNGAIDTRQAVRYIDEVAEQLGVMHFANQLHLAIRPSAIIIDSYGKVVVADRSADDAPVNFSSISGTVDQEVLDECVDYLPPEVALGGKRLDATTDVYGLGATLYFALLARPPFLHGTVSERLLKHQLEMPDDPIQLRPDVSQGLSELCSQMLAKKQRDRPQSALEVRSRLSHFLS
jgi:serine/threonine protein kinase